MGKTHSGCFTVTQLNFKGQRACMVEMRKYKYIYIYKHTYMNHMHNIYIIYILYIYITYLHYRWVDTAIVGCFHSIFIIPSLSENDLQRERALVTSATAVCWG